MKILRRYFDESQWESIDEETARKVLARFYLDADLALRDIEAGLTLRTTGAEYKAPPAGDAQDERRRP